MEQHTVVRLFRSAALLGLSACGGAVPGTVAPATLDWPASAVVLDAASGAALDAGALRNRLAAADFALLGEVHDNPAHHELRGRLIAALADRHPAVVFEQIPETGAPIAPPPPGEALEAWLERQGFDPKGWRWPLHRPVIEAAVRHGRAVWGSGVSRELLRSVVRGGDTAAPAHLRPLLERTPLDSAARAALDRDLIDGHCGRLPASMIPGMRAAQVVRDAAMTRALLQAAPGGPAWLIAGNGHVRNDMAVPRLLRAEAPGKRLVVVGFLERDMNGAPPGAEARAAYDVVVVTARVERGDPCAGVPRGP